MRAVGVLVMLAGSCAPAVQGRAPAATVVTAVDRATLDRLVPTNRTHAGAVSLVPGSRGDAYGTAVADTTSLDNRYALDGLDTTSVRGTGNDTWLPHELVDDVAVLTGGGDAATARYLGAAITAETRHGTNELHGSVFATYAPGALVAARELEPSGDTLQVRSRAGSSLTAGAELGGPIVRDHAWFWVGVAPQLARTELVRTVSSRVDCGAPRPGAGPDDCALGAGDGVPDLDPATGVPLLRTLDTRVLAQPTRALPAVARIDVDAGGHRASATAIVIPTWGETPGFDGVASTGSRWWGGTADVGARWSHTALDGALRLDANAGWHHFAYERGGVSDEAEHTPLRLSYDTQLAALAEQGLESRAVGDGCRDGGPDDLFPNMVNCPVDWYWFGGTGDLWRERDDRLRAELAATARVAGGHELRAGLALTDERSTTAHVYSGGAIAQGDDAFAVQLDLVRVAHPDDPDPAFDTPCTTGSRELRCQVLGDDLDAPGATVDARGRSAAAYVGDTWRPRRDLVVELGARYEAQQLLYPSDLAGALHPLTGERLGDVAISDGSLAPRAGVAWDPTDTGDARVFAHAGRYVEHLPTAVVTDHLSRNDPDGSYPFVSSPPYVGAPDTVAPDAAAGYEDELVVGAERRFAAGVAVGASWSHRRLGAALEDVYADDHFGYTNPDAARRSYDGVTLTLAHHATARWTLLASYTYSRVRGNYAGVLLDEQVSLAHATRVFDVPELVENEPGVLAFERPHYVKLDAAYAFPVTRRGTIVVGTRGRALSGTPRTPSNTNGDLLLARGSLGRTPATFSLDLRVAYVQQLAHGVSAEVFANAFNVLDRQDAYRYDDQYAQPGYPLSSVDGGDYADLIWLRDARRNQAFGRVLQRYNPASAEVGARVRF